MDNYDEEICRMLKEKENEMIHFLNKYMSKKDLNRIGEDIIRIMPNRGDIAKIKLDLMVKNIK